MRSCTVLNCSAPHYGLGLCRLHYRRAKEGKHGLTLPPCRMCGGEIRDKKVEAEFCSNACKARWERRFGCYTDRRTLLSRGPCTLCRNPVHARGLCRSHYMRRWRFDRFAA